MLSESDEAPSRSEGAFAPKQLKPMPAKVGLLIGLYSLLEVGTLQLGLGTLPLVAVKDWELMAELLTCSTGQVICSPFWGMFADFAGRKRVPRKGGASGPWGSSFLLFGPLTSTSLEACKGLKFAKRRETKAKNKFRL